MNMEAMIDKYFRPGRLPHIWCPAAATVSLPAPSSRQLPSLTLIKTKSQLFPASAAAAVLRLFRFQYSPFRTWTRFAGSDRR